MDLPGLKTLNIGEIFFTKETPQTVYTVLGSCVAVVFHVPGRFSALCHAQLPGRDACASNCYDTCPHPCFEDLPSSMESKYVNCSLEYMIRMVTDRGIGLSKVRTALLGGASIIPRIEGRESIGELNIRMARAVLERHGITINHEFSGGTSGITMRFYPGTGMLQMSRPGESEQIELACKAGVAL